MAPEDRAEFFGGVVDHRLQFPLAADDYLQR